MYIYRYDGWMKFHKIGLSAMLPSIHHEKATYTQRHLIALRPRLGTVHRLRLPWVFSCCPGDSKPKIDDRTLGNLDL